MEEFINSFGRNNLIIVISIVFAILLALLTIVLIEKIKKRKYEEIEYYEEDILEEEPIVKQITPSVINDTINDVEEYKEEVVYAKEKTVLEAKKELEDITRKLVEQEMQDNLIGKTAFEEEQEEKSVISYEELIKSSYDIDEKNDALLKDEGTEPITIEELYKKHLEENEPKEEVLDNPIFVEEPKKFKNSALISPVFGIYSSAPKKVKQSEEYLERTMDLEDLELEIKKTEEFLHELKKLKNKLD